MGQPEQKQIEADDLLLFIKQSRKRYPDRPNADYTLERIISHDRSAINTVLKDSGQTRAIDAITQLRNPNSPLSIALKNYSTPRE